GSGLFLVLRSEGANHVGDRFHFVEADVFGLVVGPLIGGLRLEEELLSVGAMSEQGDHSTEHGEDGHSHGNWNGERVLVVVFVFGKLDAIAHLRGESFRGWGSRMILDQEAGGTIAGWRRELRSHETATRQSGK